MNTKLNTTICLCLLLLPLALHADDFSLSDGREYKDVTVSRIEPDGVVVITGDGVEKLPFSLMPKEVRAAYPYKPVPTPAPAPVMLPSPAAVASGSNALPAGTPKKSASASPAPSATPVPGGAMETARHRCMEWCLRLVAPLIVAIVALGIAAWIARSLMRSWASGQKRREFDLANSREFQSAYAEFFSIWKLWNYCTESTENDLPEHGEHEMPHATSWSLLERATMAESRLETVFLNLSAEGVLDANDIDLLGRFRQAYRTLGNAIQHGKPLPWNSAEHPEYVAFRQLATSIALLIDGENPGPRAMESRANTLVEITSNRWERNWSAINPGPDPKTKPGK